MTDRKELDQNLALWSIKARHDIQREMLNLFRCLSAPQLSSNVPACDAVLLLVGVSFALWRGAFLANYDDRNREQLIERAKQFLEAVFSSNIINFSDDRRTIDWSGGFYLNNAGYRLHQLHSFGSEFAQSKEFDAFAREWPRFIGATVNEPQRLVRTVAAWDLCYSALKAAVRNIMVKLDVQLLEE